MHIDMDAFFASVEQLDNPELRGKPVAVGGAGDRGVVSAASYEIRKFGVRSAMPGATARRLCPQGVFLPVRMWRYKELSRLVMSALCEFSPLVEQASVDEAYLDATGLERLFGPVEVLSERIRARVREITGGLTCSVGAAPVRFLAKIASDQNKPDGVFILRPEDVPDFLRTLPVGKIPGVGKRGLETLRRAGVRFAGDVPRHPRRFWEQRLGKWGGELYERCQGLGSTEIVPFSAPKSCSAENTFARDTLDRAVLRRWLLAQSDRVAADLRRHGVRGRTVVLKAKYADFRQVTRSHSLEHRTSETDVIFRTAQELLDELAPKVPLRLIGVGVSNFEPRARQLSLLENEAERPDLRRRDLEQAVDAIRGRFGRAALQRAELLDFDGRKIKDAPGKAPHANSQNGSKTSSKTDPDSEKRGRDDD
ncbi:MAG: DNA polymerase IV [Desulfovibrio sp.]